MQTIVKVQCRDQALQAMAPKLAAGGVKEIKMEFSFCPLWDGFGKTAVFYRDPADAHPVVIEGDNTCVVPHEVTQEPGAVFFGVYGTLDDVKRTTEVLALKLQPGPPDDGTGSLEPTPSVYEQLLSEMGQAVTIDLTGDALEEIDLPEDDPGVAGNAVLYDKQALTAEQRAQALQNVHGVSYDAQNLTAEQQAQARKNLGVPETIGGGAAPLTVTVSGNVASHTAAEILAHIKAGGAAVLVDGDVLYNFAGHDSGVSNDVDPKVAFMSAAGLDTDLRMVYVTGNEVLFYRFSPDGNITAPASAKVGQTIVVKAVDEHGVPTEWEAADIGSVLTVTVADDQTSHSAAEIAARVQAGGTVVLRIGDNLYNFVAYDDDMMCADFLRFDVMDGEYIEHVMVCGRRVYAWKMPIALKSEVVKTVNGMKPDENGDVTVEGGGSAGLIVTVTGTTASHSSVKIAEHVKAGGTVVLQRGEDLYNFVNYSEDADAACFIEVDAMDVYNYQMATVSGNRAEFHKMPFALESEVVKTVNGVEPDENGNVEIAGGSGADVSVGTTVVIPETHFSAENGEGYEWDPVEGILFNMKVPPVIGETYTMTVNGVSYEVVATEEGDGVMIRHEDADGNAVGIYYDPALYRDWGNFNSCFYSYYWEWEYNEDYGDYAIVPEPTTISLAQQKTTIGDVVIVKSVDETGKPKELETCNLLKREQVIFPKTYLSKDSPEWDEEMACWNIKLNAPLIAGKTYIVTVDGVEYTAVAEEYEDSYVYINVPDVFHTDPSDDHLVEVNFYSKTSGTLCIKAQDGLPKLNLDYIDIAELKAALGL